jgi:hypothetical protein
MRLRVARLNSVWRWVRWPEHISFGNTIKRPADIAFAYAGGIAVVRL